MRRKYTAAVASLLAAAWIFGCAEDAPIEPQAPEAGPQASQAVSGIIPGQYIIVFRDDVAKPIELATELAARHGLRLRHRYQHSIRGFSAVVPERAVEVLRRHPAVKYVEPNAYMYMDTHPRADRASVLAAVAAPTNLEATALAETQVRVTWQDNSNNEWLFEVFRSTTGPSGSFSLLERVSRNIETYDDTSVDPGQQYCYKVRASRWFQTSDFSNVDCATTPGGGPQPPAAPSGLTATAMGQNQIDLSWNDNSDNEDGFKIERCRGSACSDFSQIDEVGANVTSYSNTGLQPNSTYRYRVRAVNAIGESDYSNVASATTEPEPQRPAAPSDLSATAVDYQRIDLSWTDNSNNEDVFRIERCEGSGCTTFAHHTEVGANVTDYSDTGLLASTTYRYRVYAWNSVGESGLSNEAEATTLEEPTPPAAPTNLQASAVDHQQINLSWNDNADNEDGFKVERKTEAGSFAQIATTDPNVTSFADVGLQPSTTYTYRVRAFNTAGNSGYSNTASATTEEGPGDCDTDPGGHDSLADLWGIAKVKANLNMKWKTAKLPECAITVQFYSLDTGVDSDHPDLNVVESVNFVSAEPGHSGEDGNGHGTHTSGTVAAIDGNGGVVGVAPGAPVYGFRVLDDGGSGTVDDIIAAIDEVIRRKKANSNQPMVVNMSLSGGANSAFDEAVREGVNAGIVFTMSAGNGRWGFCWRPYDAQNVSPARVGDDDIRPDNSSGGNAKRVNGAITVTSSNQNDSDVNCNYGNPVTVAAPGVGIYSTYLNSGYATMSGTSMAAPHVAGAAILYLHGVPGATPTAVEDAIVELLDAWSTNDTPNAERRLNAENL